MWISSIFLLGVFGLLANVILGNNNIISEVDFANQVHAPHDIISFEAGTFGFVMLKYLGAKSSQLDFYIVNSTGTGKLYQLAQNYIKHGYDPKYGQQINVGYMISGEKKLPSINQPVSLTHVSVIDPKQRIFYMRPSPDRDPQNSRYGTVDYIIKRKSDGYQSQIGTIYLLPTSNAIVGSDFSYFRSGTSFALVEAIDGWTIVNPSVYTDISGNPHLTVSSLPTFEPFRLGELHHHYLVGTEDSVDIPSAEGFDKQLWYFQAPSKFLGNLGIAYRGYISFSLTAISGDFSLMNDLNSLNLIELECSECDGPIRKGIKLVYRLSQWPHPFNGKAQHFRIHLYENGGWLKDSQNVLIPFQSPSKCDMLMVLGRLSSVRILGDFTQGFETIALDDVLISNSKMQIPTCAIYKPDNSVCFCEDE